MQVPRSLLPTATTLLYTSLLVLCATAARVAHSAELDIIQILDNGQVHTYTSCIMQEQYTSPVASCSNLQQSTTHTVYKSNHNLVLVVNDQLWVGCGLVYKLDNVEVYQCAEAQ